MYQPIQSERLYERIVEQIERHIVAGELKVGDQLPAERELAEQFGVSRTAVREAVKALREKGLVEIQVGRGTFVTNSAAGAVRHSLGLLLKVRNDFSKLAEVREILEPEIAALAATRVDEENIAAMLKAIEIGETALDNSEIFVESDLDFHTALAEATQNSIIPALMDSIIDLLREQRKQTGNIEGSLARGQYHHKKILEAVIQRDPQAARQTMKDHLLQVRNDTVASTLDMN